MGAEKLPEGDVVRMGSWLSGAALHPLLPSARRTLQRRLKAGLSAPGASNRNGSISRRWVRVLRVAAMKLTDACSLGRGGYPVPLPVCPGAQGSKLDKHR